MEKGDNVMEYLYHYTNIINMRDILASSKLALTPSNLKEPTDLHVGIDAFGRRAYVSDTDKYKPVVWLTDSQSPAGHGLEMQNAHSLTLKTRIRFVLEKKPDYYVWNAWATRNRMNKSYRRRLTNGMDYLSWYVCEHEIPLSDVLRVEDVVTGEIYYPISEK